MATAEVLGTTSHPHQLDATVSESAFNLDELIRRKRDLEKNKRKFHLTEADCSLILIGAHEYTFQDGQVILEQGQELSSIYRIKSGRARITRTGFCDCDLPKGWFIGETILLGNNSSITNSMTLVANGPVTLLEVNVPFVRRLFAADGILALKFYRSLASKLASIFYAVNGNCLESFGNNTPSLETSSSSEATISEDPDSPRDLTRTVSFSSTSSSDSSRSSGEVQVRVSPALRISASGLEFFQRRRASKHNIHATYKEYPLAGNGNVHRKVSIKHKKVKLISESFGFTKKKSIAFSRINSVSRTSDLTATVIFDTTKAKTLFFKDNTTAEEFASLVENLVMQSSTKTQKRSATSPLSTPISPEMSPLNNSKSVSERLSVWLDSDSSSDSSDTEEDDLFSADNELIKSLADKKVLKKGDVLIEEGDLFQRLYTVTQGSFEVAKNGKAVCSISEGRVFGEASLLHLRPSPFTLTVSSEEATVRVIPAHKLFKLTDANPLLAARLHKKAAQLLEEKISACKLARLRQMQGLESSH